MPSPRSLGVNIALVAITALLMAQVVTAAPASKVGTAYWSTGGTEIGNLGAVVDTMDVPPGKYHVIATIGLDNRVPQQQTGAYVNEVYCALFAAGVNTALQATLGAGEFESMTLEIVVDATRATPTAFIDVECKAVGAVTPLPYASVTIVANSISGIVDLRTQ